MLTCSSKSCTPPKSAFHDAMENARAETERTEKWKKDIPETGKVKWEVVVAAGQQLAGNSMAESFKALKKDIPSKWISPVCHMLGKTNGKIKTMKGTSLQVQLGSLDNLQCRYELGSLYVPLLTLES